jgi:putative DNA primase/helicase
VTVQRTFLDPRGRTDKPFPKPKRLLGDPRDGAIRLGEPGETLGLAEGLEDAASAMLWFRTPVWAVMGVERYARVAIPDSVRRVVIFGQNNRASTIGVERALSSLRGDAGRAVELRTPDHYEDWNDAWRARLAEAS